MGETGTSANPFEPPTAALERPNSRPPGEMGPLARLFGVFTAPGKTFASIARFPGNDWLLPLALLLLFLPYGGLLYLTLASPKVDVEARVQQMAQTMSERLDLPEDKVKETEEKLLEQTQASITGNGRYFGLLAIPLFILIVPLIYHGLAAAFGKKTTYKRVLTAYTYVQSVHVVKGLVLLLVVMGKTRIPLEEIEIPTLLKSNLGAFLPTTVPAFVRMGATFVDVFEIWALILGVIALSRVTKFKTQGAAAVVVSLWVFGLLLVSGAAALRAMFLG